MVNNNTALNTFCLPNYDSIQGAYIASTFLSINTLNPGTGYVIFPSTLCTVLKIDNNTGTTIEVLKNSTGATITIPSGLGGRTFSGITNANQLSLRRVDHSNSIVTITAEAITA